MDIAKLKCPECGEKIHTYDKGRRGVCVKCDYSDFVEFFEVTPDICITVGKTKSNGRITFFFNSKTKNFYVETHKIFHNRKAFGPYKATHLLEIQVSYEDKLIYEKQISSAPMIAGGVLFGAVGALAGSMIGKENHKIKKDSFAILRIKIDDIKNPSYYIESKDLDIIYKFINIVELLNSNTL